MIEVGFRVFSKSKQIVLILSLVLVFQVNLVAKPKKQKSAISSSACKRSFARTVLDNFHWITIGTAGVGVVALGILNNREKEPKANEDESGEVEAVEDSQEEKAPPTKEECQVQWDDFVSEFTRPNPIDIWNDQTDYKIRRDVLDLLLQGIREINFGDSTLDLDAEFVKEMREEWMNAQREALLRHNKLQSKDQQIPISGRAQSHVDHMDFELTHSRSDELTIVLNGGVHVLQYYLATKDNSSHYGTIPLRRNSTLFTEEFYKYKRLTAPSYLTRFLGVNPDIHGKAGSKMYLSEIVDDLDSSNITKMDDLLPSRSQEVPLRKLVISDVHWFNETQMMDQLPHPACLVQQGIRRVRLLKEMRVYRPKGLTNDYLAAPHDVLLDLQINHPEMLEQVKKQRPDIYKLLKSGKVVELPAHAALYRKLKKYEKHPELSVSYNGLETSGELRRLLSEWGKENRKRRILLKKIPLKHLWKSKRLTKILNN